MARTPPLLPFETLRRVLRTARFDGTIVLVLSGAFALIAAIAHDVTGAGTGLAIAAAGAMELHGAGLLRDREEKGMHWLIASQLFLLACVLWYTNYRLNHFSVDEMKALLKNVESPEMLSDLQGTFRSRGVSADEALRDFNQFCCLVIGIGTVLYQGGMAFYYRSRQGVISTALKEGD